MTAPSTPTLASDIATRAATLVPGLLQRAPVDGWTGFRPGSPAAMPYMERWQETKLWLAYGHFRNGILLAPATSRRIAREVITY
ncbi:MAG: FAD-dependent oxidoreductase [Acidobacteria bacterium]|nr:FAD-dependent oxidoreductase [Acidobacteriota bacterium]